MGRLNNATPKERAFAELASYALLIFIGYRIWWVQGKITALLAFASVIAWRIYRWRKWIKKQEKKRWLASIRSGLPQYPKQNDRESADAAHDHSTESG